MLQYLHACTVVWGANIKLVYKQDNRNQADNLLFHSQDNCDGILGQSHEMQANASQ